MTKALNEPKYMYSINRDKNISISIASNNYRSVVSLLNMITKDLASNTAITIQNGKWITTINGGVLRVDDSSFFENISLVLLNPKFTIKPLLEIEGETIVNIEQNNIGTKIYHYDDEKILTYLTFTNNLLLPTKIISPDIGIKKCSLSVSQDRVYALQEAKKTYNAKYFIVTIDKETFEIIGISITSSDTNEGLYKEVFNKKYLSNNFKNFESYKVRDLFPISAINNKYSRSYINIFLNKTSLYVQTTAKSIIDVSCYFNASKTTHSS